MCTKWNLRHFGGDLKAASRSAPRMERMRRRCSAHAHCPARGVVGLLAYRANGAVGEHGVREERRPTHVSRRISATSNIPF